MKAKNLSRIKQHNGALKLPGWAEYHPCENVTYVLKGGARGASFALARAKKIHLAEAKDDFLNASWIMSEAVLEAECKALEDTLE